MSDAPDFAAPDYGKRAAEAVAAAEAAPHDVGLLLNAAEMLLRAGAVERALGFARDALVADPASFRAARTLSGMLDAAGHRGEAIQVGEAAVRLDPDNAEVRLHLGGLLAADRHWREAAAHLAVHVASVDATAAGWRLLSSVLHQAGDTVRATDAAAHAVEADPGVIEYRLHLASLLSARAEFEAALEALAVALEQAPDNPLVWRARCGALAALGRLDEALVAAERAVALAPGDLDCLADLDHVSTLCAVPMPVAVTVASGQWTLRPRRQAERRRETGLWEDVATRWRVAYAIILRDIRTRFGHTRLGYLWAIVEPISHLGTLGMVFFILNNGPPPVGDNLFVFYITGLLPFLMFSHVSHEVMSASEANNVLLQLPIVKRTDVMVAGGVRQLATELCVFVVIFSVSALLGQRGMPSDVLTAAGALFLLWLLGVGIGAINLVIVEMFPSYITLYDAVIRLLYFSSGIYYSPIAMPDWVRSWLEWNPILQGIEYFRSGFFHGYEPHWLDVNYLLVWVLVSISLGFTMERSLRSRMVVSI